MRIRTEFLGAGAGAGSNQEVGWVRVRVGFRSWVQVAGAGAGKVRETFFHFFAC